MKMVMQKCGIQDGVSSHNSLKHSSFFHQAPLGYSGHWQGLEAPTPLWIISGAPSMALILQLTLLILDPVDSRAATSLLLTLVSLYICLWNRPQCC